MKRGSTAAANFSAGAGFASTRCAAASGRPSQLQKKMQKRNISDQSSVSFATSNKNVTFLPEAPV